MKLKKQYIVIAPVFFSILPIFSLYNQNSNFYEPEVVVWPLIISTLSAFVITGILSLLTSNVYKASLICSIFSIMFFSYSSVVNVIEGVYFKFGTVEIGANKIVFASGIVLAAAVFWFVKKSKFRFQRLTSFLLVSSTVSLLLPLITAAVHLIQQKQSKNSFSEETEQKTLQNHKPDIYYILLDGFARKDIFQDRYGGNDSVLVPYLKETGFFVAEWATSNYCQTLLSLSSSLNYDYLDKLTKYAGTHSEDRRLLKNLISNNRLLNFLKKSGYTTVSFNTGYWPTTIKTTDLRFSESWSMDDFSNGILLLTPIPALLKWKNADQFDQHRKRILYTFDQLGRLPNYVGHPFFVFAHLVAPHPPFVFNSDGSKPIQKRGYSFSDDWYTMDEYRAQYKNQHIFIAVKTKEMINTILENSPEPPVIILQSDHGPASGTDFEDVEKTDIVERMSILNALYIPKGCSTWAEMSPVNTFRVVLNTLFNTDLELLEHKSFFSTWSKPYMFIDVTEKVRVR